MTMPLVGTRSMSALAAHTTPRSRNWHKCPVCTAQERAPYVTFEEQLQFVRCDRCGVVYKSFEIEALRSGDFYEEAYFHGRKSARDKRFAHRVRKCKRQIRAASHFVKPTRLLDVGCSFGYVLEAARQLDIEAAGVDLSQYAVDVCRKRGYRAEVGELTAMPFDAESFDVIIMKHVLEHTPDPAAALKELHRISKPNAVLLIVVPNLDYWKGRYQRRRYRYFRPDDLGQQHYVYYTESTLSKLLETHGFAVRSDSKAVRPARPGPMDWLTWPLHRGALALAGAVKLRRETFVIAQRPND